MARYERSITDVTAADVRGFTQALAADIYAHTTWLAPVPAEEANRIYRNITALLKQICDELALCPPQNTE